MRGQTLVIFALVLSMFFAGMLALVADLGSLFVAYNRVDDAVLLAVQAGASAIDESSFYTGGLQLDAAAATQRCQDSLVTAHLDGRCTADARSVSAEVRQLVPLPVPLLGVRAPVHVSRTAQPAFGGDAAVRTT
ncbi:MAG TPA: hypothetical protein VOB72_00730 [Candidatus Dormibacteraeota bacterium]|nr:hypothetical protein [Candidatus Dormibacteraeota bacterium]